MISRRCRIAAAVFRGATWVLVSGGAATALRGAVLETLGSSARGRSALANGGFEAVTNGAARGWSAYKDGYRIADGAGRGGGRAILCDNPAASDGRGAAQTIRLDQAAPAPLVVRGWSRAEGVGGGVDNDYSLYVDLHYADGSPLWGQTAPFRIGTHDWQYREFAIRPEKPVASLTLYALFRHHAGRAWFDDLSVEEVRDDGETVLFMNRPVRRGSDPVPRGADRTVSTSDGLALTLRGEAVTTVRDGERAVSGGESNALAGGFFAWDAAAADGLHRFENGACRPLGLALDASVANHGDRIVVEGSLADTTGRDRGVTLLFALPVDAAGWTWGDDVRRSRAIAGRGDFLKAVPTGGAGAGTMSLYPLGAVWDGRTGLALAADMARPAVYRVGYHAGLKHLYIAYDVGLAAGESGAAARPPFRFVIYRFDPRRGFRAAFDRLMEIFPDHFAVRERKHGLWMPFTDVSTVRGWEDFGFRFHEGDNNVPFDDANGILSFRYTEPMTWWMPMDRGKPRTPEVARRIRDALAAGSNAHLRAMAGATRTAAMFDESGEPGLLFRNEPWCNGVVWSLNPNPRLPGDPNAATVHWNDGIRERLYGPGAKGARDGEYLDSIEGYVTVPLNFRREHFRHTTVPLTYATESAKPVLFKGLAVFEFTKWIADDLHRMGKLVFANGVPYRLTYLCPWLDVLGTETGWMHDGAYRPASDEQMMLWRSMSGGKPYLLLMNTDYDTFAPHVEAYFQRALFYGMWPGFFSHNASENPYWKNPGWYDRDRPLFRQYIPIIRDVSEAGWQPLTGAACDDPRLYVERYGPAADGRVYLTVMNDSDETVKSVLKIEPGGAWPACPAAVTERISGRALDASARAWPVELAPHQTFVIEGRPQAVPIIIQE